MLILIFMGLAVHLLLPQITQLEHAIQVIQDMRAEGVGLAIGAQILSYVGSGILLQAVVALTFLQISLLWSVLISLASASIGLIAGGIVGSSASIFNWMRRAADKPEAAMLASTLPPFINNLILLILSLFGLLHLLVAHELSTVQTLSFALTVLLTGSILLVMVWGVRHRERASQVVASIANRWAARLRHPYLAASLQTLMSQIFEAWDVLVEKGWQRTLSGAVLSVLFDMLTLYFLFVAAGYTISPGVLLVGYGIPLLLGKMAFFLPGGVGVVEASMVRLYTALGVPESVAVVVVLAYRVLSFWVPTLIGFPVAAYLTRDAAQGKS